MDIWGTLKNVVATGAPILANALIPGSGGLAAALIGDILGVDPNDPQAMLEAARTASPEQWVALQKAQLENKADLARISADLDKAYLGDRQSARDRDTAFIAAGRTNTRANWMIVGDVFGLIACLATLFMAELGEAERAIIITFGSYFGLGLRDAHQFEFGSSRGSKDKDLRAPKERPTEPIL